MKEFLDHYLRRHHISRYVLAQQSGISQTTWSDVSRRELDKYTVLQLKAIGKAVGKTADEVLYDLSQLEDTDMKKVTFSKDDAKNYSVDVDGETYGKLTFDGDQNVWVLWPDQIDDAVSYSNDLKETEDQITDEIQNYDDED